MHKGMPELSIELTESARSDLAAMVSWYKSQGVPEVGERFVAEILARVEDLGHHPELGRVVPVMGHPPRFRRGKGVWP
ncbi:MAG: type II toxin-antitoxin system RelE/ParE family toxin [Gammaproteobacteria bacterium]|nr:type II toxin-antitoxin system RelE/ParE family toxin [Gammaproteobacteria bacterium]MYE30402.1 type II toxin-antitoxin system RelE/ParE family toxin [Gammaproteobacteria bacterium]